MGAFIDMTGERYGRLIIIKRIGTKRNSPLWLCNCECGNQYEGTSNALRSGNTESCGCIHKEQLAKRNKGNAIHGEADNRLYGVWHGMKQRCYDINRKDYKSYGGRGVKVSNEWINDYYSFHEWSINNGYDKNAHYMKCTLDRIDVDGPYAPWNCRWVDAKTQANNRRNRKKEAIS